MARTHSKPSNQEWEIHKAAIRRLYLIDEIPQKELLNRVKELELSVIKAELEYQLKLWGFKRNIDKETWPYIDNRIQKRKRENKDSEVVFGPKRIKVSTVQKETRRHRDMTVLARIAPPPSPQSPKDADISICTPQLFPMEFVWPTSLPWLRFESNYSYMFSSFTSSPDQTSGCIHSKDVSRSLIASLSRGYPVGQRSNPLKLASTLSISMPEEYSGEHLVRAQIIRTGSGPEFLSKFMKMEIFRASNNFLDTWDNSDSDKEWDRVIAHLQHSGITKTSFDFGSLSDPTLSAFTEKLFQWAFSYILKHQAQPVLNVCKWLLRSGQDVNIPLRSVRDETCTPLQASVQLRRRDLTELLLENGADVNFALGDPKTPLEIAVQLSKPSDVVPDMVQLLLASGANVNHPGFEGPTSALHEAISTKNLAVVKYLVNHGASLRFRKVRDRAPPTAPLGWAASLVNTAPETVSYLLEVLQSRFTSAINGEEEALVQEALVLAASKGNNDVVRYLHAHCSSVDAPNADGITALTLAAAHGHIDTCKLLIHLGAQVDPPSRLISPIHTVCLGPHLDLLDLFIAKGADVNKKSGSLSITVLGQYFLTSTRLDRQLWLDNHSVSPLEIALKTNNFTSTVNLIHAGAKLGGSELLVAVKHLNLELLQVAIQVGANPNQTDDKGRNALQQLLLLDHGVDLKPKQSR
ncbi:ankyrin repeat-containing domain protein [Podospora fimiseda]|uniref:Ankyrin repeat-containing domain protein n=1 Tax=Podospora fimiseda TaxID=252190 RepID=A0AAN7BXS1_9PEZI|nr:ankyrin repeat-containing domain protein [Podospora fimiseda]